MTVQYSPLDYRNDVKPVWCVGCGHFGVLNAVYQALATLQLPPENVALVSGIGCSSRLPGYVRTYGFNALHGRVLPIALGVKLARPETVVIGITGDGDALSIGMGHYPHAARRNIDITLIMMDNGIYGLTKGQVSPTLTEGEITKTTIYGNIDHPIDAVRFALGCQTSLIARSTSLDPKHMAEMIVRGIKHRGFSLVHVLSPCVTFRGREQYNWIREHTEPLPESHNPEDFRSALDAAYREDKLYTGLIYQEERDDYGSRVSALCERSQSKGILTLEELARQFLI
ncbi:MAG: 2-oxoacid:ferredoxin oxidoreductase subunit beta [Acidobacteriota bacterium]